MINIDKEFLAEIKEHTDWRMEVTITCQDSQIITITPKDMTGDNYYQENCDINTLPLGGLVLPSIHLTLINSDYRFNIYDFTDAEASAMLYYERNDGSVFKRSIGKTYKVNNCKQDNDVIVITLTTKFINILDNFLTLDKTIHTNLERVLSSVENILIDFYNVVMHTDFTSFYSDGTISGYPEFALLPSTKICLDDNVSIKVRELLKSIAIIGGGFWYYNALNDSLVFKRLTDSSVDFQVATTHWGGVLDTFNDDIYVTGESLYGGLLSDKDYAPEDYDSGGFMESLSNFTVLDSFVELSHDYTYQWIGTVSYTYTEGDKSVTIGGIPFSEDDIENRIADIRIEENAIYRAYINGAVGSPYLNCIAILILLVRPFVFYICSSVCIKC